MRRTTKTVEQPGEPLDLAGVDSDVLDILDLGGHAPVVSEPVDRACLDERPCRTSVVVLLALATVVGRRMLANHPARAQKELDVFASMPRLLEQQGFGELVVGTVTCISASDLDLEEVGHDHQLANHHHPQRGRRV